MSERADPVPPRVEPERTPHAPARRGRAGRGGRAPARGVGIGPRRRAARAPDPGRWLGVALWLGLTGALAGCGAGDDAAAHAPSASPAPAGPPPLSPAAARGRVVFLEASRPTCASCHALKDAGTASVIGPDLDQLKPSFERTRQAVTDGIGIMPAQHGVLSPEDIEAVSRYVAEATGR